jgi:hypothetical protein
LTVDLSLTIIPWVYTAILLPLLPFLAKITSVASGSTGVDLFRIGDLGYDNFRIPVLASVDGPVPALVAVCEARKFSFMDWGSKVRGVWSFPDRVAAA